MVRKKILVANPSTADSRINEEGYNKIPAYNKSSFWNGIAFFPFESVRALRNFVITEVIL